MSKRASAPAALLLLAAGHLLGPATVRAQSLWNRRDPYSAYLFVDTRARHVGDLVTIVVQESTDLQNQEVRNLEKKTNTSGVFGFAGKITGGKMQRAATVDFNSSLATDRKMDGTANFSADRKFIDRMTATVVGVLPNGNLVIEGMRQRILTGEERMLRMHGVIRPIDIAADNTILSQFIADLQVNYEGKGQESAYSSHNWWSKLVNHFWPF